MSELLPIDSVLACPRCSRSPLDAAVDAYHCRDCRATFPLVAGIPWLFAEPAASLNEWRSRFDLTLKTLEREQQQLSAAARASDISDLTRRRLSTLADAKQDHAARLQELLEPVSLPTPGTAQDIHLAFRTRLPADQGLMTYAYNVFRDWSWGHEENERSFEIVREGLQQHSPRRMLVLGAGSGRLAYDLHMRTSSALTAVFDFNPFLLILAQRVTRGDTIELYEFPLAPKGIDQVAVLQKLRAADPAREGLHFLLGDVLHSPLAAGSFDTVVTPWLVDILPERFDHLCRRINALLSPGGRWVNFGSLQFHVADPSLQFTTEECVDKIAAAGFAAPESFDTTLPYLCSPASRHGRRENVFCWSTIKREDVAAPPVHEAYPAWIVHGDQPVPLLDAFRQLADSTRVRAYYLSLIDGRRSLRDMARVFVDQNLMSLEEAEAAIRASLMKMYDSSRRP